MYLIDCPGCEHVRACYYLRVKRWYLPAGFVVGVAVVIAVWGSYSVGKHAATTGVYTNPTFGFSVRVPSGYSVSEARNAEPRQENGTANIIEFAGGSSSVQLNITYASYASPQLSVQSLLANFPSIARIQTQPFPIAAGETGLALYDDPAHPDEISDVWFGKNGLLYQMTAYGDGYTELLPIAHSLILF